MSVSLANILFVHEILYRVAERHKEKNKYSELIEDPLFTCFDPLSFKMPELEDYPAEERKHSLNFTLPPQILVHTGEITKCSKCKAIVTSELVPQSVIDNAYEFPNWICNDCNIIHNDWDLRCTNCRYWRDPGTLGGASMLKRYKPPHSEPILAILEEILITALPLISEGDDDFNAVIQVLLC
eukprot:TRINITY_DN1621_c0_g3_i1.p1 TRINITY_DN1621_c0_g3~~TRINITY_DN1621_c0_g3_i1.p1  ORF type:complete len:213 (-),score=57.96 TRINITY_DN1621_c0_g3_i1:1071-1619(-)